MIWDFRGPRGIEFGQLFRMSQATCARILASVMYGSRPIGAACAWAQPALTGSDEYNDKARESQSDPKQQTTSSMESRTTKASEDILSDLESSDDEMIIELNEDTLKKGERYGFLEVTSPTGSSRSSSTGISRPVTTATATATDRHRERPPREQLNSEVQRPATEGRQGFLPQS